MNGTLKASGVTFYFRNGQMIMRSAHSNEKRSNTRGQFIARQRMKHSIALWQRLKPLNPMFIGGKSTYTAFTSLANRLPVVFCPDSSSLLMPGIPVSSGPMPSMEQRLDIIEGTPALVTDLKRSDLQRGDHLMLYTAREARFYVGEGDIDIASMVAAIPDVPLSIELPHLGHIKEFGVQGHAQRCLDTAKAYFAKHGVE